MTLQSSGAISIGNINVELGVASTTPRQIGDGQCRGLAGVASGAISMSNFYGKSALTFSPAAGGTYSDSETDVTASVTLTSSIAVTWTWTRTSGTLGSSSPVSGSSATSITFSLAAATTGATRSVTFAVTATDAGSNTYSFTVQLTTFSSGGGGVRTVTTNL
jgi:hypothetical protein